ncbi:MULTISPECIES: hypothetical protein [unclassified Clostridium]|uniref:hypothetical protein n=1 Tax=unclassified Clostridium TaxID=2614128 RepID=UPI000297FDD2|nr:MULTISPECIES: hypothetical protein [unclassified Clostridium]EKQ56301.1 MAG: hypothetical protein A370_02057 [Clostridium sp. Maddingley MBC34-26]
MECNRCSKKCEYNNTDEAPCDHCKHKEKLNSNICNECIEGECKFKKIKEQ